MYLIFVDIIGQNPNGCFINDPFFFFSHQVRMSFYPKLAVTSTDFTGVLCSNHTFFFKVKFYKSRGILMEKNKVRGY